MHHKCILPFIIADTTTSYLNSAVSIILTFCIYTFHKVFSKYANYAYLFHINIYMFRIIISIDKLLNI